MSKYNQNESIQLIDNKSKVNKVIQVVFVLLMLLMNIQKVMTISTTTINISLGDVLLIPVMLILLGVAVRGRWKDTFPYWWLYVLLAISCSISAHFAFKSQDIASGGITGYLSEMIKTITCIAYFYIGYNIMKYINEKWIVRLWAIAILIFVAYGLIANWAVAHDILPDIIDSKNKGFFLGTYKDPNQAATYLIMSLYILFLGIKGGSSKWMKLFYIFTAILTTIALFLTDSRGGVIAFGVSIGVYFAMVFWDNKRYVILGLFGLISVVCVALLTDMYLTEGYITGRIFSSLLNFNKGLSIREVLAKAAFQIGNQYPLIGIGRGNFPLNSASYLEGTIHNVKNLVPHTTYVGLYAEVGIIGAVFYATPIWLIVGTLVIKWKKYKEWFKGHSYYLKTIICIGVGVGIQAMVLNLENRRAIWFMLGWILMSIVSNRYSDKNVEGKSCKENNNKEITKRPSRFLIIMSLIMTIALYVLTAFQVSYTESWKANTGNYKYEIPLGDNSSGEEFILEYRIHARQKEYTGKALQLSIIEEYNGSITLLNSQDYNQVSGSGKLSFKKQYKDSKVYILIKKVNIEFKEYRFIPVRYYNDKKSIRLDKVYALVPQKLRSNIILKHEEKDRYEERQQSKMVDHKTVNYEDKIIIKSIDIREVAGERFIDMKYGCVEVLKEDYTIWFYGIPDNLHLVDSKRWTWAHEYYSPTEKIKTSEWKPGKTYTITYKFPRNEGWYKMRTGIYKKQDGKVTRLIDKATSKNYVELGWFNAEEEIKPSKEGE